MMPDAPRATTAYRPEQQFFPHPVTDRLMAVTMTLAAEVYVLRERVGELEGRLAGNAAPEASDDERNAQAAAFAAHVLGPLLGEQQARGPQ